LPASAYPVESGRCLIPPASAVGLEPEDNRFFAHIYPWLGFRIGYIR
jgi:hypothetical protein